MGRFLKAARAYVLARDASRVYNHPYFTSNSIQ